MKKTDEKTVKKTKKVEKKETIAKDNKVSKTPIEKKSKKTKEKKVRKNIFKIICNWFKEEFLELKRVSWPSKKVVGKNFLATIVCIIFLGILFYAIDIIMVWLKTVVM